MCTSEPNEHLWDDAPLRRRRTIGRHDANTIDIYNLPAYARVWHVPVSASVI